MKSVIVAAGKVVDTEDLKISAEVAAVYAKENDESGSSAKANKHIVSLRVKQFNAGALPADVMNYAAIAELAGDAPFPLPYSSFGELPSNLSIIAHLTC